MDQIADLFRNLLANPMDQQMAFIAMVAGSIFIFVLGLSFVVLGATDPIRRRLTAGAEDEGDDHSERRLVVISTMVGPIAEWVMPKSEIEQNATIRKLAHAGFRAPNTMQTFYGIKFILAISLPIAVLFVARWLPEVTSMELTGAAMLAAGIGVVGPSWVLDRLVFNRLRKLRHAFPDALDLLVVCVEAGLGLAAALQRVADELCVSHPELATELALVNAEMRAGVDRARALRNLAERTGLEDIRGLVSLLVQTMRFGTSVADALRVYSEEFRDRRMQKAEEEAAKIGTKLIFPLVFCLFPSFFIIAIGPAVIRLIDVFRVMEAGTGG